MGKILFEKEVLEKLNLPSIPVKKWNGKDSFKVGVAVISLRTSGLAYAIASYDSESDAAPRIKKVFSLEQFIGISEIFVVPTYMDTVEDVKEMDLDNESKEAAMLLAEEAKELESEESDDNGEMGGLPEWVFDNIHNAEEATAFISSYNKRNKIRGNVPKKEEGLKLRLLTIYKEIEKNQ